jgi:hypothetical protein
MSELDAQIGRDRSSTRQIALTKQRMFGGERDEPTIMQAPSKCDFGREGEKLAANLKRKSVQIDLNFRL